VVVKRILVSGQPGGKVRPPSQQINRAVVIYACDPSNIGGLQSEAYYGQKCDRKKGLVVGLQLRPLA
jgi:hypothetical protein